MRSRKRLLLDNPATSSRFKSVAVLATASAHAQYHIYWGDMHGHTANSDGKGSLDDYFTHARDVAKLDFVVVIEETFVHKCSI